MAADPALTGRVRFVKVSTDGLKALSKAQGASALPYVGLYAGGERLLGMQVTPSRAKQLRANVATVLAAPSPVPPADQQWALDPNGFAVLVNASQAAAKAEAAKRDAAAAVASTASLSERLLALAGGGGGLVATAPPRPAMGPTPPPARTWFQQDFFDRYGADFNPLAEAGAADIASRLPPGHHYLDFTGAGLYTAAQLDAAMAELKAAVYGNPHSANPSSALSDERVEAVRAQVLAFLSASPEEYQVVFTASATAALKHVSAKLWRRQAVAPASPAASTPPLA